MQGQLEKLQTLAPTAPTIVQELSGYQSISEVLNSAVSAQLQDAVNAVSTISRIESLLDDAKNPREPSNDSTQDEQIIDAEYKEV